jgi:hypothetical protein
MWFFKYFRGSSLVIHLKKVFLPVNDQLGWHASVGGFPGAHFFGTFLQAQVLGSH